jgi:hypothetical protein
LLEFASVKWKVGKRREEKTSAVSRQHKSDGVAPLLNRRREAEEKGLAEAKPSPWTQRVASSPE